MNQRTKLRPVLDGEFWLIGATPDIAGLLPEATCVDRPVDRPIHECVDHHVFRTDDGVWHLWGCIRKTPVGRILYHWEADSLTQSPWQETGEIIRADHSAGESLRDRRGEEWLQSPFVVRDKGTCYMFYGGHSTGVDVSGHSVPVGDLRTECQICLMTSTDGRNWTRHRNDEGYSRLFLGPGEARDPCVIKIDGLWHLYYAGYHLGDPQAGYYVRTSTDLVHWSDWRVAHQDGRYGPGLGVTECPHVVFRMGYYYLFRTEDYPSARTHVFRSEDPFDFGIGDASDKYMGLMAVAAPEIIVDGDGAEYITSNHDLRGGTRMCRLGWEED